MKRYLTLRNAVGVGVGAATGLGLIYLAGSIYHVNGLDPRSLSEDRLTQAAYLLQNTSIILATAYTGLLTANRKPL